jgi:hypothetical protein
MMINIDENMHHNYYMTLKTYVCTVIKLSRKTKQNVTLSSNSQAICRNVWSVDARHSTSETSILPVFFPNGRNLIGGIAALLLQEIW